MKDKQEKQFHVALPKRACTACLATYSGSEIAIQKYATIKPLMPEDAVIGWGTCPKCQKKIEGGHVLMVEVDEAASGIKPDENKINDPGKMHRTGRIAQVSIGMFKAMFGQMPGAGIVFIDEAVIPKMEELKAAENQSEEKQS